VKRKLHGWGLPPVSRKAHYFVGARRRSLCGRWVYTGDLGDGHDDAPGNCGVCRRYLAARRKRRTAKLSAGGS
jgi:hypothetical protein